MKKYYIDNKDLPNFAFDTQRIPDGREAPDYVTTITGKKVKSHRPSLSGMLKDNLFPNNNLKELFMSDIETVKEECEKYEIEFDFPTYKHLYNVSAHKEIVESCYMFNFNEIKDNKIFTQMYRDIVSFYERYKKVKENMLLPSKINIVNYYKVLKKHKLTKKDKKEIINKIENFNNMILRSGSYTIITDISKTNAENKYIKQKLQEIQDAKLYGVKKEQENESQKEDIFDKFKTKEKSNIDIIDSFEEENEEGNKNNHEIKDLSELF